MKGIGFFVGEPDNVTVGNFRAVMAMAQIGNASDLVDEGRWRAFQDVLAEIPWQVVQYMQKNSIKPGVAEVEEATRSFQQFNFNDVR